ncbi:MAG: hypothetical protein C0501_10670 [Isosphaera sp.]|nr:hypothetical protein [Isosphaera sp.]
MPDPALQTTALRYAAGDLPPAEAAAFEGRLAADQAAREALGEAVRLSAAALGQAPPSPHRSYRALIRERLTGCCPGWLARRAYRGHPLVWAGLGAAAVAACAVVGLSLAEPVPTATPVAAPVPVVAVAPAPREVEEAGGDEPSVAEVWAALSTPEHVEKTHDDEMRWRQKFRDAAAFPARPADGREP